MEVRSPLSDLSVKGPNFVSPSFYFLASACCLDWCFVLFSFSVSVPHLTTHGGILEFLIESAIGRTQGVWSFDVSRMI
jgi:hypothetical protein